MKQGEIEANHRYLKRFKSGVNTAELVDERQVFCSRTIMENKNDVPTTEEILTKEDRRNTVLMLWQSDNKRYGDLSKRLKEEIVLDRDEHPTIVVTLYELMVNECPAQNNNPRSGIFLLQQG